MPPKGRKGAQGRRRRKPYAWERGLVKSSVPAKKQQAKCMGCAKQTVKGALRMGYCSDCWAQK